MESIVHPDGRSAGETRRAIIAVSGVSHLEDVAVKLVRLDGRELRLRVDAWALEVDGQRAYLVSTAMR